MEKQLNKQTAIEWLGYELNTNFFYNISPELWEQVNEVFNQAKAMERIQIIYAYDDANERHNDPVTGEQYYNEQYEK